jgi:hypothetical protein
MNIRTLYDGKKGTKQLKKMKRNNPPPPKKQHNPTQVDKVVEWPSKIPLLNH